MNVEAPSPDPKIGQVADKNAAIAGRMQDLAETQYADQKALLNEYSPLIKNLITKSTQAQDTASQQSASQWDSYTRNFAPIEQKLADKALTYDTPERQAQAAAAARGEVSDQFGAMRDQRNSDLASAGVMPGSGAGLALDNASRIEEAKAKAGAANTARTNVESMGLSYLDNAARFGRNMPSTGVQTAALAQQAGGQAQGQVNGLSGMVAAPGQAAAPLFSGAVGANNAAGSLLLGQNTAEINAANSNRALLGDVVGAGAKAYGMGMFNFLSSEKLKDMGEPIGLEDAIDAVEASPAKAWSYKPGLGDGNTKPRMGPTAEGLRDAAGPAVSNGNEVDAIGMLGLHHAAIGGLAKKVARLEHANRGD